MRRISALTAVLLGTLSLAAACSSPKSNSAQKTATTAIGFPATTTTAATGELAACQNSVKAQVLNKGVLTVATDSPVYTPWFVNNSPSNGRGYESAVAFAVAGALGFDQSHVNWVTEAFSSSYAPGPKKFDFDINEVSVTPERSKVVTFSKSYYDTTQSIVALAGSPITKHHSPADLKTYLYGDQVGSTGLAYINSNIQPTQAVRVYNTLDQAVSALQTHQVDGIVVDTPDAQYMATQQVKHGALVGQFPSTGEHFGLLFAQGSPLESCVNLAIDQLQADGTIAALNKQYLGIYNSVPMLKP
ncbi:MAG: ABC transporter substrate-binding protein [Actinomycetes bacterium]